MRRLRDRRPAPFFRGAELARLASMVLMLGVLALLIDRARDSATWRWLAPGDPAAEAPMDPSVSSAAAEQVTPGATDEDPLEVDAAREEFQAVTDKSPLVGAEMPAYWRLAGWQEHQSIGEMIARAARDATYNDLWQRPDKWRGRLITMPVHLNQVIKDSDLGKNPLGIDSVYEVYGWNSDSDPNWFMMVTPRLPPGMPADRKILEEATFVGYFLKLQPYEDREGKQRAMPLLIGRLIWHPTADPAAAAIARREWAWPWIAAGVLAVLFTLRWGYRLFGQKTATGKLARSDESQPGQLDAWLDDAQRTDGGGPQNGHASLDRGSLPPTQSPGGEITGPPGFGG
jgi:hypothetical protein